MPNAIPPPVANSAFPSATRPLTELYERLASKSVNKRSLAEGYRAYRDLICAGYSCVAIELSFDAYNWCMQSRNADARYYATLASFLRQESNQGISKYIPAVIEMIGGKDYDSCQAMRRVFESQPCRAAIFNEYQAIRARRAISQVNDMPINESQSVPSDEEIAAIVAEWKAENFRRLLRTQVNVW